MNAPSNLSIFAGLDPHHSPADFRRRLPSGVQRRKVPLTELVVTSTSQCGSVHCNGALPTADIGRTGIFMTATRHDPHAANFWMAVRDSLLPCRYDRNKLLWVADRESEPWDGKNESGQHVALVLVTRVTREDYFRIARRT